MTPPSSADRDDRLPDDPPLEALEEALQAYLHGETGIRFEALAQFAEPLFELYEVDLRAQVEPSRRRRDAQELATLLAVLDTARLLWAYFALDEDEARRHLPRLQASLLGPDPSDEERTDFLNLLFTLEEHWYSLDPHLRAGAAMPGFTLPPFELLLTAYDACTPHEDVLSSAARYGPEALETPEALALFARPLLEDSRILDDPDRLDMVLSRVNAYWELAQAPPEEQDRGIAALKQRFARSPQEARRIEQEARMMVSRFFELFPEQRGAGG